jgi:hypothetical protein
MYCRKIIYLQFSLCIIGNFIIYLKFSFCIVGNSYGCDDNNNCCVGCGPQEQFYGCSDIAITSSDTGSGSGSGSGSSTTDAASSYHNCQQVVQIMLLYVLLKMLCNYGFH